MVIVTRRRSRTSSRHHKQGHGEHSDSIDSKPHSLADATGTAKCTKALLHSPCSLFPRACGLALLWIVVLDFL
jgi:hypothetical protein